MRQKVEETLDLFSAVETGATVSQVTLSRNVGVAVGMINALLKRSVQKGYIKVKTAPARRYAYYLTPKGLTEKSRLVGSYLHHSLSFFRQARAEYLELLQRAASIGHRSVVLIGGGELAEIALLAAREARIDIIGVIPTGDETGFLTGVPVYRSIDEIKNFGLAVLTTYEGAKDHYDTLVTQLGANRVAAPDLLRVVVRSETRPCVSLESGAT